MKNSYINYRDLAECLRDYFNGTLDNLPILDRLVRSPRELHPSNSLWGQLLSEDIYTALQTISPLYMCCIVQEFTPSATYEEYITHIYNHSSTSLPLWEWQSQQLANALPALAEVIRKSI
ncbi:hypothetical protein [Anabaena sp. CCY 9402-a]|uniref:hypothetical protein n=1 Tax=Anabaena sp. CCY 9402-a TaxID=3103867 RepID=UPI0039C6904F